MTDDQTPDFAAVKAALTEAGENLLDAVRTAWAGIKPALSPVADSFVLVPNDVGEDDEIAVQIDAAHATYDAETLSAAEVAISACLEGNDDHAVRALMRLDAEQLHDIAAAANLLAERADARQAALTVDEETETR